jgi:hypothetical protein
LPLTDNTRGILFMSVRWPHSPERCADEGDHMSVPLMQAIRSGGALDHGAGAGGALHRGHQPAAAGADLRLMGWRTLAELAPR